MLRLLRVLASVLCVHLLVLGGASSDVLAQPRRSPVGRMIDREEARRQRAEYCAEVGQAECERQERSRIRSASDLYPMFTWIAGGVILLGLFARWRLHARDRRIRASLPGWTRPGRATPTRLDLVVIDIALEPGAASVVRGSIGAARAESVPALARALLFARDGWTHAAVRSWPAASPEITDERYRKVVAEAHARVTREPGALREAGPGYRGAPRREEDHAPVVMASLAVCSLDELPEQGGAVADVTTATLRALAELPEERLDRVDLTWLPTGPDDALFAAELLALHPRLLPVASRSSERTLAR